MSTRNFLEKWIETKWITLLSFCHQAAEKKLLGLRFPKRYGGREMPWTAEMVALEEVGVLGMGLGCSYAMVSIVGEALNRFRTDWQKKNFLNR